MNQMKQDAIKDILGFYANHRVDLPSRELVIPKAERLFELVQNFAEAEHRYKEYLFLVESEIEQEAFGMKSVAPSSLYDF